MILDLIYIGDIVIVFKLLNIFWLSVEYLWFRIFKMIILLFFLIVIYRLYKKEYFRWISLVCFGENGCYEFVLDLYIMFSYISYGWF